MTRRELAAFWDEQLVGWLRGEPLTPVLGEWKCAYRGELEDWAFPEPYIGDLLGSPRVVLLANNPGIAREDLQARGGVFSTRISEVGFTKWASTRPFDVPDSESVRRYGPIRHTVRRLEFARRFLGDASIGFLDLLTVELYPWHSRSLKGSIRVPPHLLREFIIEPLSEFGQAVPVLALARGWADALERATDLLEDVQHLDGFAVPSRRARLYHLRGGGRVLVVWHSGSDAPPAAPDTERLRAAWFGGAEPTPGLLQPTSRPTFPNQLKEPRSFTGTNQSPRDERVAVDGSLDRRLLERLSVHSRRDTRKQISVHLVRAPDGATVAEVCVGKTGRVRVNFLKQPIGAPEVRDVAWVGHDQRWPLRSVVGTESNLTKVRALIEYATRL